MTFHQLLFVMRERGITVVMKDNGHPAIVPSVPKLLTQDILAEIKKFKGDFILCLEQTGLPTVYEMPDWREFQMPHGNLLRPPWNPGFLHFALGWRWHGEKEWRPMPPRGPMLERIQELHRTVA